LSIPPLLYQDVKRTIEEHAAAAGPVVSTVLLELPHRELGGKLTPWSDVWQLRDYCRRHHIQFHCDGARLFEAAAGYNNTLSLEELCAPFDSVYVSFYKGLGGLGGSVLAGTSDFMDEARAWLRRYGGNLYTLLPYVVAGRVGYRRYWKLDYPDNNTEAILSFAEKKHKLVTLVAALQQDDAVRQVVSFDPTVPETNMVHAYLQPPLEDAQECLAAAQRAYERCGIRVVHRVSAVPSSSSNDTHHMEDHPAHRLGYRVKFEWTMGQANGQISNEIMLEGWRAFANELIELRLDKHKIHNNEK